MRIYSFSSVIDILAFAQAACSSHAMPPRTAQVQLHENHRQLACFVVSHAEFMKLRVTVEAIELAKALLVLDKPAARANARYAASLRSYDRADGHVPPEATSVDTEESEKSLQLCKSLLEEPERILEPWETVDGAPAVRVPRRQAYKVEKARLEALSQLLDMLIARAQQQRGPPERPPAHRLVQDSMRGSGDRGGGGVDESAEVGELAPLRRQRTQVQAALDALPEAVDAPE